MNLEDQIKAKFAGVSTTTLIDRMNRAADFKYDDEEYELNRRLRARSLDWRWAGSFFNPHVEVFDPATGQPVTEH